MGKRILIIDDSEFVLQVAQEVLTNRGYSVATAATLDQMAELIANERYDLVLMDLHMPELYGDDIAASLRTQDNAPARIYLFSSMPREELEQRSRESHLDGYISKLDGLATLVQRVDEVFSTYAEHT